MVAVRRYVAAVKAAVSGVAVDPIEHRSPAFRLDWEHGCDCEGFVFEGTDAGSGDSVSVMLPR